MYVHQMLLFCLHIFVSLTLENDITDHVDSVKDIAWFDRENNCYHIQHVSTSQKDKMTKDFSSMTCSDGNDDSPKKYILTPSINDTFKWYVDLFPPAWIFANRYM